MIYWMVVGIILILVVVYLLHKFVKIEIVEDLGDKQFEIEIVHKPRPQSDKVVKDDVRLSHLHPIETIGIKQGMEGRVIDIAPHKEDK